MNEDAPKAIEKDGPVPKRGPNLRSFVSKPGPLVPYFFGFAFSRAANDLLAYRFVSSEAFGPLWGEDMYSLAMIATFLVFAALARSIAPLYERRIVVGFAVVLAVSAALFALASTYVEIAAAPLLIASMVVGGIASALFILLWAEFHSCLDPLRIVIYVSGAFLFGSLLSWMLQDLGAERLTIVLCTFPLLSVWWLKASFSRIAPMDLPRRTWGRYEFPWKLIVVLGVYELVYGTWEASPTFVWETYSLGVISVALVMFVIACFFSKRFDFAVIYRTPFVLMICGFAMAPLTASLGEFVSDLGVSAGYSLMFLVLTFLFCDLSHRYGVSVLVLCGVQELTAVFRLAGHQVPDLLERGVLPPFVDGAFVSAVLTLAVVLVSVLLMFGKDSSRKWGASFFGVGKMADESDDHRKLVARCAEISAMYGLSPREREVLELVAQGKRSSAIERELVIANGTLKSHLRRIYQKLGIHSKKELYRIVDCNPEQAE